MMAHPPTNALAPSSKHDPMFSKLTPPSASMYPSNLCALRSLDIPKIEIHLSNIYKREEYRKKSITSEGVDGLICGFGSLSYILAIEALSNLIYNM